MYLFMAHHLKLDTWRVPYDNGIQENFVKVLWHKDLEVFSADNPLPSDALQGDQAVMDYLGIE